MKKEILKRENKFLKNKNIHLANIIGILSDDLKDKENEIDKLKSDSKSPYLFSTTYTPYMKELFKKFEKDLSPVEWAQKHIHPDIIAFDDPQAEIDGEGIKEEMMESDVAFSSRFMPNVKFSIMGENSKLFASLGFPIMGNYIRTAFNGDIVDICDYKGNYDKWIQAEEVSIYEAIPELVPDGMVYDKESDSLVKKDIAFKVTEVVSKCDSCVKKTDCSFLSKLGGTPTMTDCFDYEEKDAISSFAKKLADTLPFNCSEIQWVINTFGENRARNILDMLRACGLKLSDIEPLKK